MECCYTKKSMTPPFRTGLEKGNNSISAFIPTLPGGAFKGGGKGINCDR